MAGLIVAICLMLIFGGLILYAINSLDNTTKSKVDDKSKIKGL